MACRKSTVNLPKSRETLDSDGLLKVWGPTGATEDMGTAYAVDHFLKAYNCDATTRNYALSPEPGKITVQEFDYKAVNGIVYDENGVVIRSVPPYMQVMVQ